jgi:hypothetical protein
MCILLQAFSEKKTLIIITHTGGIAALPQMTKYQKVSLPSGEDLREGIIFIPFVSPGS